MDGQLESGSSSDGPFPITGCDSKMVGDKRGGGGDEFDEKEERPRKQVKMRDLQSVLLSSGVNTHNPEEACEQFQGGGEKVPRTTEELLALDLGRNDQLEGAGSDKLKSTEVLLPADMDENDQAQESEQEMSKFTKTVVTVVSDASDVGKSGGEISTALVKQIPLALDLNSEVGVANNTVNDDTPVSADNLETPAFIGEHDSSYGNKAVVPRGAGLDLNDENIASSGNQDQLHPLISYQLEASEVSECGSTTGSQEEKDMMRIWHQMKQNGFLSSSSLGATQISAPKQRGRKTKGDTNKKKMDIAKKEQVDRLTKMVAPSGLLNELNPGIINHVRNRKQVHSIIEALVKSEKREKSRFHSKHGNYTNVANKETGYRKGLDETSDLGTQLLSHQDGHLHFLTDERQTKTHGTLVPKSLPYMSENTDGDGGNSSMAHRVCGPQSLALCGDGTLALKLSSETKVPENFSSLSHEESENLSCVSSLSVKAANVALRWLELLHQDIKGRLAALRRSKKRVRAVITTELPLLISKELPSNQENDPYQLKSSADPLTTTLAAEMHKAKWSSLFSKMDQSLAEEEGQLENWLYQVSNMQRHCEQGLQQFPRSLPHGFQQSRASENESGSSIMDRFEKELSIRAAAASIYSTCNFLSSNENASC